MKTNNKIPFLNYQFLNILSTFGENYFTEKARQSLIFTLLKPFLKRNFKSKIMKRVQQLAYKVLPDIRSQGRRLLQDFSKILFENDFRDWLSKHKSKRSRKLLIARVDDTKSGRKYGFKIPELQYLYDYVKKSKYKTHQLYVLMISIGEFDYIVDYIFEKSRKNEKGKSKIAYNMLTDFIKRLSPDLREEFGKEVRIALDGAYGNIRTIEDFVVFNNGEQKVKYSLVVKSGGKQKFIIENNVELGLKEIKKWMIKNKKKFKKFDKCHKLKGSYKEVIGKSVEGNIKLKLVLCRFKKKKGGYRYLLLLTNRLDWHAFQVLKTYKGRWPIETMFRTLKQKLKIKKYSFHSKISSRNIEMFFGLRLILYMILNQYRVRHTRRSRTSLNSVVESFQDELSKLSDKKLLMLFSGKLEIKSG
jgi:hypothetical protein